MTTRDLVRSGLRTVLDGPYAGVGHDNPDKAPNVRRFTMTLAQKQDMMAFLETLTDTTMLRDPALSNPWIEQRRSARRK